MHNWYLLDEWITSNQLLAQEFELRAERLLWLMTVTAPMWSARHKANGHVWSHGITGSWLSSKEKWCGGGQVPWEIKRTFYCLGASVLPPRFGYIWIPVPMNLSGCLLHTWQLKTTATYHLFLGSVVQVGTAVFCPGSHRCWLGWAPLCRGCGEKCTVKLLQVVGV
jgi:hypothetical protein